MYEEIKKFLWSVLIAVMFALVLFFMYLFPMALLRALDGNADIQREILNTQRMQLIVIACQGRAGGLTDGGINCQE